MTTPAAGSTTSERDPRWAAAVAELQAGNHFEAHELWESLWVEAVGEEKLLLQGLVQIAAGYAKLDVRELNGARKLLERGLARLGQVALRPQSVELGALSASLAEALAQLRRAAAGEVSLGTVPRPRWVRP